MNLEQKEKDKMIPEFLLKMLKEQYGEQLTLKIVQGYEKKRSPTLRVNTIKTTVENVKKQLQEQNIKFDTVKFSKEALILKDAKEIQIRETSMYKNGEIYLQTLSSMLPPIILEPKKEADILDMAAAPGGKTTQIAALSKNQAHITACEMNLIRAERLKYNIEKQGASSVYIMIADARQLEDFFSFDQILLDAPCSGSGTLYIGNQKQLEKFNEKLIRKSKESQIALLKKAIKILKTGEELVYSTCSILQDENEEIVKQVLENKKIEIVPISFEGMEMLPMLPVQIKGTLCLYPNELFEGFYIAKIRKGK